MHVLKIEYPVADYDTWRAAFDRNLLDGKARACAATGSFAPPTIPTTS